MVLRKITVDISVRYIPKSEQSKEKDFKRNTIRIIQTLENKIKIFHETLKISLKIFQHMDSNILNEY